MFNTLTIACETKTMLIEGGIANQPNWFIQLMAWFAPAYDLQKFIQRAQMILGDGSDKTTQNAKPQGKSQVRKGK